MIARLSVFEHFFFHVILPLFIHCNSWFKSRAARGGELYARTVFGVSRGGVGEDAGDHTQDWAADSKWRGGEEYCGDHVYQQSGGGNA
jgi:hypothetical protein